MYFRNLQFALSRSVKYVTNRYLSKIKGHSCGFPVPPLNITVTDACSNVGQISAFLLKQEEHFKNIFLFDTHKDPHCLARELNHIDTVPKVTSFCGIKKLEDAIKNARIVYICGGLQVCPEMTERDIFYKNACKVRQIIMYLSEFNPNAMVVIVSPLVAALVPMAIEEFKKNDINAERRVFGMVTTYRSRANSLTAARLRSMATEAKCSIVGGTHRRTVIPVLSHHSALNRLDNEIATKKIQEAEEDALYEKRDEEDQTGCFLSTAYCAVRFTDALARAIKGAKNVMECAFVKQTHPMDEFARYFTTMVKLGKDGIESCHLPTLSDLEKKRLSNVIEDIRANIHMGESYITGEDKILARYRPKKKETKVRKKEEEIKVEEKKEPVPCPVKKPPRQIQLPNVA